MGDKKRKQVTEPGGRNRCIKQPPTKIKIDNKHKVTTTSTHKFLGVLLDDELQFQKHAALAIAKGEQWVSEVKKLSKVMKGMHGMYVRRLFYSVAAPSMLYTADVWCTQPARRPGTKTARGMGVAIQKMESVQRKAALQATGALRTTPSDLLFAHADMLPLRFYIKTLCQRAALRITMLLKDHPIYTIARKAMGRRLKRHMSPLYEILDSAKIHANEIETIGINMKSPTWRNKVNLKTIIAPTREDTIQYMNNNESDIKIYMDGSSHKGGVGAAAILTQGIHPTRIA